MVYYSKEAILILQQKNADEGVIREQDVGDASDDSSDGRHSSPILYMKVMKTTNLFKSLGDTHDVHGTTI